MAMKKLFNLVLLIFMVSLVIEKERMVKVVEAEKFCWTPSKYFHGICISDKNCARTCEQEGALTGVCKGWIDRKCMCGSECGGGGYPPPGEYVPEPPPGEYVPEPPPGEGVPGPIPVSDRKILLLSHNVANQSKSIVH